MIQVKLLALVLLALHSVNCSTESDDKAEEALPRYFAPYNSQNYGQSYGKGYQSVASLLDTSCQRYTCTPTTSPVASCALVCAPDRRTPFCPILYCTSATAVSCANFKCQVQQPHMMFNNYY